MADIQMSQEHRLPSETKSTAEEPGVPILAHVHSWNKLCFSQKKDDLLAVVRSSSTRNESHDVLSQLEAVYDDGELSTTDFRFLIRVASCLSFSIHILRTRTESPILISAINVFRIHWCKTSHTLDKLLAECGGPDGIVGIAAALPLSVAIKLLQAIGDRGRKDTDTDAEAHLRTRTADSIICAAIPYLDSNHNAPSPIRRLAPAILKFLLPAASETLLRSLIPRFERSLKYRTWTRLALGYPNLIAQLIFIQLEAGEKGSGDAWANGGILEHPQYLFAAVLSLSQTELAGKDFLWNCITSYASHIQKNDDVAQGDIFGLRSDVPMKLAFTGLTARMLKNRRKEHKDMQYALEVLDVLTIIRRAEGRHEWEWEPVLPVLECAVAHFSRHREEWLSPTDSQKAPSTGSATATMVFWALFKDLKPSALSLSSPSALSLSSPPASVLSSFRYFTNEARYAFWTIAIFIRFSLDLTNESVTPPRFPPFLLYTLGRSRGESILRRGIEAHGNEFLSGFYSPDASRSHINVFRDSFNTTLPSNAGDEHCTDAQKAVMHAAWLGSDIRRWGDIQHPHFTSGLEEVERDVSRFKKIAASARTGTERLAYLKVVLAIIFPSGNLDLLDETLAWMAKRFVRDPEAGAGIADWLMCGEYNYYVGDDVPLCTILSRPLVKLPHKDTPPDAYVEGLRQYYHASGKVLRTLKMFLELLAAEPGRSPDQTWQRYGEFLEKVIQERTTFISGFPDAFIKHVDLRGAVYEDLSPLILSHGSTGLLAPHPAPSYIGDDELRVPRRLWKVVIPWVDGLAVAVEDLCRTAYGSATEDTPPLPIRDETFWPIQVILTTDQRQAITRVGIADFDITTTHYYRHLESWLFSLPSVLLSKPADVFDRYHGSQRMQRYVEDYLTFSRDEEDVSAKVLHLLSHYGAGHSEGILDDTKRARRWEDHSLIILRIPRVMDELRRSPRLFQTFIDPLLPKYTQNNEPTKIIWHDPLENMSRVPIVDQNSVLGHSTQRLTEDDRISFFGSLMDEIQTRKNTAASPHHMACLAFVAVAHISTFNRIPAFQGSEGVGPISHALQYFRLKNLKIFANVGPERILEQSLPYVAASEVKRLIGAITALPLTERTRPNLLGLLGVLRRYHEPFLSVDLSFYALADAESSSWHRQILPRSLFHVLTPTAALSVMDRFLEFLAERRQEQLRLEAQAPKAGDSDTAGSKGENGDEGTAVLKISTIKMFLQLLNAGIEDGVFSDDTYHLVHNVMDISPHPSVLEAVIDVLVRAINVHGMTSSSGGAASIFQDSGLSAQFASFVRIGARLAEKVEVTDDEWDAITKGDAPMPAVDTSSFIGFTLLKVQIEPFAPAMREMWIDEVLTPLLCGHVANRTKWLKAALSREGGSAEDVARIHGSFDAKFDVPQCFRLILDYFSLQGPTKKCRDALLPIIEERILTLSSRTPFQSFSNLAHAKHREEKEAQTYLKDVRLLTAHALENNEYSVTYRALSTVVHGIKIRKMHQAAISDFVGVVERVGESLLAPESMLIHHDPRKQAPPFSCFLGMAHALWPSVGTSGDPQWGTRIRPILASFLRRAVELEREQSLLSQNGGACYWPVIISLKVLLLPLPTLSLYSDAPDRAERYAEDLTSLAKEVLRYPGHRRLLSEYLLTPVTSTLRCAFQDVLPICRALTSLDDSDQELRILCFDIANLLIHAFSVEFKSHPVDETARNEMLTAWSKDADGMVRWMALQPVY